MPTDPLRREIVIAAVSFAVGFFVLPLAIYWVGHGLIGNYSTDASAGAFTLAESIWADALHLRWAACLVVLAPYGVVQLLRFARRAWRPAPL
jgi:hypothetical protein